MIVERYENLIQVRKFWESLESGSEMTVFQSFEWNRMIKIPKHSKLIVLVAKNDDMQPEMIAPLIVKSNRIKSYGTKNSNNISVLADKYSDYVNFIYSEFNANAATSICEYLSICFPHENIHIDRLLQSTSLYSFLQNKAITETKDGCVKIETNCSIEDYHKRLSKRMRQNLRTAENRIVRNNVKFEFVIKTSALPLDVTNDLLKLHYSRIKDIKRKDLKGIEYLKASLSIINEDKKELKSGTIKTIMTDYSKMWIMIVYLNDCIAGYLLGLSDKKSLRIIQNCYDKRYSYYSPMTLSLYLFVCDTIRMKSFETIDLTCGEEIYKYRLGGVRFFESDMDFCP